MEEGKGQGKVRGQPSPDWATASAASLGYLQRWSFSDGHSGQCGQGEWTMGHVNSGVLCCMPRPHITLCKTFANVYLLALPPVAM